ncbi:MAG TPA: SDR family oxidoreductase [Candidatus Lustribacter sp.]|nr:SDR family oxidoreductase [Candidatus Lustribacter sp.]
MSSRVALVTGAASGLAAGIACSLAAAGYRIAFTYRPGGTPPDETRTTIAEYDRDVLAVANDLSDFAGAAELVAAIEARRGPLDVVVHAVGPIVVRSFASSTESDYRAMIDGNLGSAVALASAVLPGMRKRGFGRLVFFGMNGSHVTQPARLMSLYGAAKAAVVTFARTLALEEARHGITVNVIEPGDIRNKTALRSEARAIAAGNPTGHSGSWEDVAAAVCFAVADDAGFLNGMVLGINGGLVASHE